MLHFSSFRPIACCVAIFAAFVAFLALSGPADSEPQADSKRSLYDSNPQHLWNRLHETLFVREGPDGLTYGRDQLEPLLWIGSKQLLEEKSNNRAVAVLEEFLKHHGENQIKDPLKRAVLQRDLWLVFNWLEAYHANFYSPELKPMQVEAAKKRLRRPLAAVIGRLALSPDQIQKLPDNYAAAVASQAFPKDFDPKHPDQSFLPPDLFAANGPWVCVGRPDGPIAPSHLRENGTNLYTNSAFLLFIRLPAGRDATLKYLEKLRSFDQPVMVEAPRGQNRLEQYFPNPKLPRLPVGTEMALVRRALLIDTSHAIVASPLTESVQLRIYRESPAISAESIAAALGNGTEANKRARLWQSFFEFRFGRPALFDGRVGGLRAIAPDEMDFNTPFNLWYHDEFENHEPGDNDRPFPARAQISVKEECFACHCLPGVASFNSYLNARIHLNDTNANVQPFKLLPMPATDVAKAAVKFKESHASWAALRTLLSN